MTLDFARRQRDRGIGLAEMGAENAEPGWTDVAFEFLKLYAMQHAEPFTAEDVLEAAAARDFIKPPNDRAWGGVFQSAARRGIIRKDGHGVCRKRHASVCVRWRSCWVKAG